MAESKTDKAHTQVDKAVAAEEEQGFRGVKADPTPNEHYTIDGVVAGKPTPETDPKQAEKAHAAQRGQSA